MFPGKLSNLSDIIVAPAADNVTNCLPRPEDAPVTSAVLLGNQINYSLLFIECTDSSVICWIRAIFRLSHFSLICNY